MKTLVLATSCVLLSTQAFGSRYSPDDSYDLPATPIYIEKLTFNGSGCSPADTEGTLFDTDNDGYADVFAILYSKYIAQQGPNYPIAERRKNCNILVQFRLPQGFQYSITEVEYQGYAYLKGGVNGQQESTYQFPLFTPFSKKFGTYLYGPIDPGTNYKRTDTMDVASLVWSPCGVSAPLNIRTEVALTGSSTPESFMTLDQTLGRVVQKYYFQWRKCTP